MKLSKLTIRPSYHNVDADERYAQISSRSDALNKSFVTELWIKVISRAIDDIALYSFMREIEGKDLKEEEVENESSAISFLFNDNHMIPFDDYLVDVYCPGCKGCWQDAMSKVAGIDSLCPHCNLRISWKNIDYFVTENQVVKEISLRELISLWGVDNIDSFRQGCISRIKEIVDKKTKASERAAERLRIQGIHRENLWKILVFTSDEKHFADVQGNKKIFDTMSCIEKMISEIF